MKLSTFLQLTLLSLLAATSGCRSAAGYRLPPGGLTASDDCGLQATATSIRPGRSGFSVVFDLTNNGDTGLLVPLADLEASWGGQLATVAVDVRSLRRQNVVVVPRLPGSIDQGLFEGAHWVSGSNGEPPRGEAVWVKPRSRVQGVRVTCNVPPQPGQIISVTWPVVYHGDAQGTIQATAVNGFTWSISAATPEG